MPKQYSQSEWSRLQQRLPEEDRVPYSESPDVAPAPAPSVSSIRRADEASVVTSPPEAAESPSLTNLPRTTVATPPEAAESPSLTNLRRTTVATPPEAAESPSLTNLRRTTVTTTPPEAAESPTLTNLFDTPRTTVTTTPPEAAESPSLTNLTRAAERAAISAETTLLSTTVIAELEKAESDLTAIIAQAEADTAEAERLATEAIEAAQAAEAQAIEGDVLAAEATEGFITAFNLDPVTTYSELTPSQQAMVNKGMFGGNAAFTALFSSLSAMGLEGMVDVIDKIRTDYPDISSDDALLLLKYDKRYNEPYQKRFAGNKARMAAGLAPLDDQTYLANEAAYKKIFQAYGLKQFMGTEKYANFIGNDIAPDEVAERVNIVYTRVNNAMPQVQKALLQFYPELTTQDLMAYTLDPVNQLPAIQRKIQAAEIGGAALAQNLGTSLKAATFTNAPAVPTNVTRGTIGVEAMMQAGTDAAQAAKAAAYVADVLPVSEKISSIYANGYQQYGQLQAEEEAYQGSVAAKKIRESLIGREKAEFSGQSGVLRSQRRAVGGLI